MSTLFSSMSSSMMMEYTPAPSDDEGCGDWDFRLEGIHHGDGLLASCFEIPTPPIDNFESYDSDNFDSVVFSDEDSLDAFCSSPPQQEVQQQNHSQLLLLSGNRMTLTDFSNSNKNTLTLSQLHCIPSVLDQKSLFSSDGLTIKVENHTHIGVDLKSEIVVDRTFNNVSVHSSANASNSTDHNTESDNRKGKGNNNKASGNGKPKNNGYKKKKKKTVCNKGKQRSNHNSGSSSSSSSNGGCSDGDYDNVTNDYKNDFEYAFNGNNISSNNNINSEGYGNTGKNYYNNHIIVDLPTPAASPKSTVVKQERFFGKNEVDNNNNFGNEKSVFVKREPMFEHEIINENDDDFFVNIMSISMPISTSGSKLNTAEDTHCNPIITYDERYIDVVDDVNPINISTVSSPSFVDVHNSVVLDFNSTSCNNNNNGVINQGEDLCNIEFEDSSEEEEIDVVTCDNNSFTSSVLLSKCSKKQQQQQQQQKHQTKKNQNATQLLSAQKRSASEVNGGSKIFGALSTTKPTSSGISSNNNRSTTNLFNSKRFQSSNKEGGYNLHPSKTKGDCAINNIISNKTSAMVSGKKNKLFNGALNAKSTTLTPVNTTTSSTATTTTTTTATATATTTNTTTKITTLNTKSKTSSSAFTALPAGTTKSKSVTSAFSKTVTNTTGIIKDHDSKNNMSSSSQTNMDVLGNNSGGDLPVITLKEKRTMHNTLERKRRDDLKGSFHSLREAVPELENNPKAPKVAILTKATDYLYIIKKKNAEMEELRDQEKQKNKILKEKLKNLENQLKVIN